MYVEIEFSMDAADEEVYFVRRDWAGKGQRVREKIAELAVEDTSEQMKESIKEMLGITVLDVLQGDVGKLIGKISKNSSDKQELQKIEELRAKKDNAETALKDADVAIGTANKELEELRFDLEKLNVEYSVKGDGILKQKNQLMK